MKFYHKARKAWHSLSKQQRKNLRWAVTLKPGDIVASCEGFNCIVASATVIKIYKTGSVGYAYCSTGNGWIINEVEVIDTNGLIHYFPSCLYRPETVAEIMCWWNDMQSITSEKDKFGKLIRSRLNNDLPIVDERGVLLPHLAQARKDISDKKVWEVDEISSAIGD